ncbi:MAG: YceI family protein [Elusimicrobia bacterium]|nr:YceI family protein [Elusimicrobiota bacterium]
MRTLIVFAAAKTAFAAAVAAQGIAFSTDSRLWLEGDSTLHAFKSEATQIHALGAASAAGASELLKPGAVKSLKVEVPVDGLRSGDRKLDKNMKEALKGGQYPRIIYEMTRYEVAPAPQGHGITVQGFLSVAGSSRPVTLEAVALVQGSRLRVTGSEPVKMTDHGIKPPKMMLGSIKTKDEVIVRWDLFLEGAGKESQ